MSDMPQLELVIRVMKKKQARQPTKKRLPIRLGVKYISTYKYKYFESFTSTSTSTSSYLQ